MLPGVFMARKKNGEYYYRSSITYLNKHISLGSYNTERDAHEAYVLAGEVLKSKTQWNIHNYPHPCLLSFHKWVVLVNVRDNGIYIRNPIYLKKSFFLYYIDKNTVLKFDVEDLFYYSKHKISKRGGHLYTSEYGMQVNLLSRYGIRNYSVAGRDFIFVNGDDTDFRYSNIEIINPYYGVTKHVINNKVLYQAKIHIRGDYIIGRYNTEEEAAIAYNKATNVLKVKGLNKNYPQNYIDGMDEITYAAQYQRIRISKKILEIDI
ncbi:MAG: hypothetical protein GX321_09060 [Clostridiales bacterium]|nr:hypothetical protein [Clostridiales bacterium]